MSVYFVTGKLGAGKSLSAVGRIREYLAAGRPVATNLDLNLPELCGAKAKTPVVYRLPDKPGIADFEAIGVGNASYDESRNGLVVLDECGTWFNSRTWGDKERQSIINWFLHARKLGWDLIFLVQDIAIVDKQARLTLAEHVVYCRRLDKLTIPFISALTKLFTGKPLRMPKLHFAIVKYGDQPTSLTVDRWVYFGNDLYSAYDTKQAFSDYYEHSTYQLLSPWLSRGRYMVPMNWRNSMRLTRIYLKRFSRPLLAGCMFLAGVGCAIYFREPVPVVEAATVQPVEPAAEPAADLAQTVQVEAAPEPEYPVRDRYKGWQISGHMTMKGRVAYWVTSPDGAASSLDAVAQGDVDVMPRNNCHVRVVSATNGQDYADIFRPGCIPDDAQPVVANAIDAIPGNPVFPLTPPVLGSHGAEPGPAPISTQQLAEAFGGAGVRP